VAEVLTWVVGIGLLSLSVVVAGLALVLWRLRRRNRLHPALPTTAPLHWLCSPSRAGRCHRRLRAAVAVAGYRGPPRRSSVVHRLDDLTVDLVHEAAAVDRRLVSAALVARPLRRSSIDLLEPRVAWVERLAARLAELAHGGGVDDGDDRLVRLDERLAALEDAQREVDRLEALLFLPGDPFSPHRQDRPA